MKLFMTQTSWKKTVYDFSTKKSRIVYSEKPLRKTYTCGSLRTNLWRSN